MPLHAVEALLDAVTDAEVRREWAALADAGLPSQARHQGGSNAPHLTLALASSVPDHAEAGIVRALAGGAPVPVRLGSWVVLGSRRFALARLVVPSAELLRLQQSVAAAMVGSPDVPDQVRPGGWTPHVTLARGLGSGQVGEAIAVLGRLAPVDGAIASVRRWDPEAERTWQVWSADGIPTMGT